MEITFFFQKIKKPSFLQQLLLQPVVSLGFLILDLNVYFLRKIIQYLKNGHKFQKEVKRTSEIHNFFPAKSKLLPFKRRKF